MTNFFCIVRNLSFIPFFLSIIKIYASSQVTYGELLYHENFEEIEEGKLPEDLFILDGDFSVQVRDQRKCLVLPGSPVGENGLLVGPRVQGSGAILQFSVKMTSRGRRFSSWECAMGGVRGARMRFDGGLNKVTLSLNYEALKTLQLSRNKDSWTCVLFEASTSTEKNDPCMRFKVWAETSSPPTTWNLIIPCSKDIPFGRCAIWGYTYSGEEILWDDIYIQVIQKC